MTGLAQDFGYALRTLRTGRLTVAAAIVALALGIGANSVMFSMLNALFFHALPFVDLDRVVAVSEHHSRQGIPRNEVAPGNFEEWRRQGRSFQHLSALRWWEVNLTGGDEPEWVGGVRVSADYFATVGVRPLLGRVFRSDEDRSPSDRVAVLSAGLWHRRFGGDPAVLGRSVNLNGEPYTVVGVAPETFSYPPGCQIWVPLKLTPEEAVSRDARNLRVVGRLKPGFTLEQARAEMSAIAGRLAREFPDQNRGWTAQVFPVLEDATHFYRPGIVILTVAVILVLLIACANVASLMLARASARRREIAVRCAMGAGRPRLIRQLLTESVVLALIGGGAGVLLALWGIGPVKALMPAEIRQFVAGWDHMSVDRGVLAFTLVASVLTGLLFGLAPALQASRPDLNEALKEGGRSSEGGSRGRLRRVLVVAEVALAVPLLVEAGLTTQALLKLRRVDPGFPTDRALVVSVSLPLTRYGEGDASAHYFEQALERLASLPGVESAGAISHIPLGHSSWTRSYRIDGHPEPAPDDVRTARYLRATPGYFAAIGVPILRGRDLSPRDREGSTPVMVVSRELVRREFPKEDPLGRRVVLGDTRYEIVGVVGDVKHADLVEDPLPAVYLPIRQSPSLSMAMVVRISGDPGSLAAAARREVLSVDREQAVSSVMTLRQVVGQSSTMVLANIGARCLTAFALIALVLAAMGVFAVMSYMVSRRTHEIGVRMALGAQGGNVVRMVVGEGLRLITIGLLLGLAAAVALGRALASVMSDLGVADARMLLAMAGVLGVVGLVASWLPARRATRVDPLVALRYE